MGARDGRIQRAEIDILADVGAYPHNGAGIPTLSRLVALGLYEHRLRVHQDHSGGDQRSTDRVVSRGGTT